MSFAATHAFARRLFVSFSVVAAAGVVAAPSHAQSKFPEKPVRIIVPYGPGGVADVTTRVVVEKVGQTIGQGFVVENRPGAGQIVGSKAVQTATPDGYTLLLAGNGHAIGESLFKSLPYKFVDDFVPVAPLAEFDMVLATRMDGPLDTVKKIVDHAKANPGKLNFGTIATGSTQNLAAELFKMTTGVDVPIVVYRTTPELMTAVLRGDVDIAFDFMAALGASINQKQMKAIAIAGEQRSDLLPGVPTVKEAGFPNYVVTSWNAFYGPAGVPKDVIAKINEHVLAALKTDEIRKRMAELGISPMIGSADMVDKRMKSDISKWAEVIKAAKIEKQ